MEGESARNGRLFRCVFVVFVRFANARMLAKYVFMFYAYTCALMYKDNSFNVTPTKEESLFRLCLCIRNEVSACVPVSLHFRVSTGRDRELRCRCCAILFLLCRSVASLRFRFYFILCVAGSAKIIICSCLIH